MESSLKRKRCSYVTPHSSRARPDHDAASLSRRRFSSRIHFPSSKGPPTPTHLPSNAPETSVDSGARGISTDDDLDQVIVAIDMKDSGTVGCSYYSAEEEKLYLLGDIRSGGTETVDSCQLRLFSTLQVLTRISDSPNQADCHSDFNSS